MSEQLQSKILELLKSGAYRPQRPRDVAKELGLPVDADQSHAFRDALRELTHAGRIVQGARGTVMLPVQTSASGLILGTYRHNKRGFGFVVPTDPLGHEDLFIPEGHNAGAMTGDTVRAKVTNKDHRDGKAMYSGKITEVVSRGQKRFVGTLSKVAGEWVVLPDGNMLTAPISAPDAASRHIKVGSKVVIELTSYPGDNGATRPVGVITEVLGAAGEKDVDLKTVIVQFNLPGPFPDAVKDQARAAIDAFDPEVERGNRLDLSDQIVCTIDPDDAKDYDDAISLRQLKNGYWELGVHIADVSYFVPAGTPLDIEARARGNSCYFPGHVIPMLPEILSNGVCSLQEAVPRLCKSAFITYDDNANPVGTKFANTIINSRKRLRYREAQAILDNEPEIPHPQGNRKITDYEPAVVELLHQMNTLAKRLQKRRIANGQINLDLPETELVLDESGKVVDAVPEDQSFTHTLIEMFMVEANEAVARLLDSLGAPFLRRTHPEPAADSSNKLRQFVQVAGFKLPKDIDRKAIQMLLASAKGKPEGFAINLAVLRSLTRAEYSPKPIGHYALASEFYGHFTSPIRRYADLTIHRLLDAYFAAREKPENAGGRHRRKKMVLEEVAEIPTYDDLVELGRHLSFTERQAESAERELRQVKLLELLAGHVGEIFPGVVTGITNFGVFIQLKTYLIDGLIRYENLMDDWWDVDERAGVARGQRTGKKIGIGDVCTVIVARVDPARRELDLAIHELVGKAGHPNPGVRPQKSQPPGAKKKPDSIKRPHTGGATRRNQRSKQRGRR
jgi:ribonuclease R